MVANDVNNSLITQKLGKSEKKIDELFLKFISVSYKTQQHWSTYQALSGVDNDLISQKK